MKNSSIMIRCIVDDELDITGRLLMALEEKIKSYWPNSCLILRSEEKYWKYDNSRDIVYNFANKDLVFVKSFIQLLSVSWRYSEFTAHNEDTSLSEEIEEAIWSKNVRPEEVFILPSVRWVHVYTWVE